VKGVVSRVADSATGQGFLLCALRPKSQLFSESIAKYAVCVGFEHNVKGVFPVGSQFLPQDRVSYFAQLAPGQLLVETEKAIGDSTLHDLHMELIRGGTELRELEMVRELPPLFPLCPCKRRPKQRERKLEHCERDKCERKKTPS
jgi:hypothetical protein